MKRLFILQGLSLKMIVAIFTTASILIVFILGYLYKVSSVTINRNLRVNSSLQTTSTVNEIEKIMAVVQKVPDNLAKILESRNYSEEEIKSLLSITVANNPEIFGSAIAFETGFNGNQEKISSIYVYKSKTGIESGQLGFENYDYFTADWYQIPKELGRSNWSEPYFDKGGGNIVMSTYSVPMYRIETGNKRFIGVLTADISLKWLQNLFDSITIYQTGYAFMISRNGSLITHPRKEFIMNETIFSIAEEINSPQLREIGRSMVAGKTSIAEQEYHNVATGKLSWVSYAPIASNGWSVGIVYPVDELTAPLISLFRTVISLAVAGLTVLFIVISIISRSITSPLRKLAVATQEIGQGSFDIELPQSKFHDEIGELTRAFVVMQDTLRQTIGHLKDANDALEEYSQTLEEKVETRTTALKEKNQQLDKAFENVKTLSQIGQEITSTLNLDLIFNKVYQNVNSLFDANSFLVLVLNEKEQTLDCRLAMENGEKLPVFSYNLSDKNRFAIWCIDHKKPVFINDVDEEYSHYITHRTKPKAGTYVSSILYLPLLVGDRIVGAISVQSLNKHAYTQNHFDIFSNLATYAAIALDNAFAYEKINRANQDLKEAQAQLIQAEKMASLGELTAGIAHEIKNPLNFINNFSEISIELVKELKEELEKNVGKLDKKTVENINEVLQDIDHNVRKINEHGKRADSIVKGMLLHSRGKPGEKQKTNLNDLLAEYLNLAYHGFRAQDSSFNVKLETDFDPTLEMVNVVPQNISRVFLNIFNNACYSVNEKIKVKKEPFNPSLKVTTRNLGDKIEIKIWDNGKGIPKDIMDKVFNPFFTTKPAGKGTGLGLSLSYDIVVQEHGGEMKVDSQLGEYAEFIITIPKVYG